jgi:hypothetical protein
MARCFAESLLLEKVEVKRWRLELVFESLCSLDVRRDSALCSLVKGPGSNRPMQLWAEPPARAKLCAVEIPRLTMA